MKQKENVKSCILTQKKPLMGHGWDADQTRFLIHFYLFLTYSELIGARVEGSINGLATGYLMCPSNDAEDSITSWEKGELLNDGYYKKGTDR